METSALTRHCLEYLESIELSHEERQYREFFFQYIGRLAENLSSTTFMYGSFAIGIETKNSDIDVSIVPSNSVWRNCPSYGTKRMRNGRFMDPEKRVKVDILKVIANEASRKEIQSRDGQTVKFQVTRIFKARVPIVTVRDPAYGIECDISVAKRDSSNHRAVALFSRYIKDYDDRVRQLVMAVKYWSKQRQINDGRVKINSFGFLILVIKFLQCCNPAPILPILTLGQNRRTFTAVDLPNGSRNNLTLGELLFAFFSFWADFDWPSKIVSITRPGFPAKNSFVGIDLSVVQQTWVIEDPVDCGHNVARNVRHPNAVFIFNEFRRARDLIVGGGTWSDLTSESDGFDHLMYSDGWGRDFSQSSLDSSYILDERSATSSARNLWDHPGTPTSSQDGDELVEEKRNSRESSHRPIVIELDDSDDDINPPPRKRRRVDVRAPPPRMSPRRNPRRRRRNIQPPILQPPLLQMPTPPLVAYPPPTQHDAAILMVSPAGSMSTRAVAVSPRVFKKRRRRPRRKR